MKIYIIRHGQTDESIKGIVQGWLDTELNKTGLKQVQRAAEKFDAEVDAIYSSDLKRATRTALEFRKKYPSVPYYEDTRLRERHYGNATGTHREEYDWEKFWAVADSVNIPNAEILDDFTARVRDFIHDIKATKYSSVLVVTHGGVLNRVQSVLDEKHQHYSHDNACVVEIDI